MSQCQAITSTGNRCTRQAIGMFGTDKQRVCSQHASVVLKRQRPKNGYFGSTTQYELVYRTAGIGGEWIRARYPKDIDPEVLHRIKEKLEHHYSPMTTYNVREVRAD